MEKNTKKNGKNIPKKNCSPYEIIWWSITPVNSLWLSEKLGDLHLPRKINQGLGPARLAQAWVSLELNSCEGTNRN